MSIAVMWEDDCIDHVHKLYHSEVGNLQHAEGDLILHIHTVKVVEFLIIWEKSIPYNENALGMKNTSSVNQKHWNTPFNGWQDD